MIHSEHRVIPAGHGGSLVPHLDQSVARLVLEASRDPGTAEQLGSPGLLVSGTQDMCHIFWEFPHHGHGPISDWLGAAPFLPCAIISLAWYGFTHRDGLDS
jgi:hypothetical protein